MNNKLKVCFEILKGHILKSRIEEIRKKKDPMKIYKCPWFEPQVTN
jgi:hypothetical protein